MIVVDEKNQHYKDDNKLALLTKDGKEFLYFASGHIATEYRVPDGAVNAYKASGNFVAIADRIYPVSQKS